MISHVLVCLLAHREKAQEYAERTTPEKPSIRERLADAKRECAEHKPQEGKKPGRDVPEHDCL